MKVIIEIKEAIRKNAKANSTARQTDAIVRKWMQQNNILNDHAIDNFIDCCETGSDPETFIRFLETSTFNNEGNHEDYEEEYE